MEAPCCRRVRPPSIQSVLSLTCDCSLKQEQLRTAKKKDKKHHQSTEPSTRRSEPADSRKHLQGVRVTQKNLVYVIGLTLKIINDEALALLRGQDYFGQYGKIQKIMINKRKDILPPRGGAFDKSSGGGGSSVSVYVTFSRKEDAAKCIAALDGATVDGNTLRAAYGTTKYCTAFLQHRQCQNPNCMYLHSEQDQDDTESHTREETATIQHAAKMGQQPPSTAKTPVATVSRPSPPTEDKPDRPILPNSVSWAKAAVGARAHSPPQERIQQGTQQDQRRQSIPPGILPTQPSPISTSPDPHRKSPTPSIEMPNMMPTTDLVAPSEISLALATSDQRSHLAMRVFDKILENFTKGSFKFGFSSDILDTDEYKMACQVSPYFHFKKDLEGSESESAEDQDASKEGDGKSQEASYSPKPRGFDPFASTMENGAHKRRPSRFAYVNDPISKALAQPVLSTGPQSQLVRTFSPPSTTAGVRGIMSSEPMYGHHLQGAASTSSATTGTSQGMQYKTATPPPPGMYLSHAQQFEVHRRQQLLDQARMGNYNPDHGYYFQQQQGGGGIPAARNYGNVYDDGDHAGVYAPQARRHLLDNQGHLTSRRRRQKLTSLDSLQDLSGSLMNMRMSPHLSQGFGGVGGQPPLPQSYAGGQNTFGVGRRYMGNAF